MASPASGATPPPTRPPPPNEEDLDGPPPARPPPPSAPTRPPAPNITRAPQRAAPKPPPPASTVAAPHETSARTARPPVQRQGANGPGDRRAVPTRISRDRAQSWAGQRPPLPRHAAANKSVAVQNATAVVDAPPKPPRGSREGSSASSTTDADRQTVKPRPPPSRPTSRPKSVAISTDASTQRPFNEDQPDRVPVRPPPPPPGRPSAPPGAGRRPAGTSPQSGNRSRSTSTPVTPDSADRMLPRSGGERQRLTRSVSEYSSPPSRPATGSVTSPTAMTGDRHRASLSTVTERSAPTAHRQNTDQGRSASPGRRRFSIRGRKKEPAVEPQGAPPNDDTGHPTDELGILNRMVVQCVGFLNQPKCLNEEGLFRVPGDMAEINKLRSKFVRGVEVDLSKVNDPNTVAGLLKLHYRELRFSIVPRGEPIKTLTTAAKTNDVESAKDIMKKVPEENTSSLKILLELLWKVAENSDVNKMTAMNLGQTVGMAIFHDMGSSNAAYVLRFLIEHRKEVFP